VKCCQTSSCHVSATGVQPLLCRAQVGHFDLKIAPGTNNAHKQWNEQDHWRISGRDIYEIYKTDNIIPSSSEVQPITRCTQNFIANWGQRVGTMERQYNCKTDYGMLTHAYVKKSLMEGHWRERRSRNRSRGLKPERIIMTKGGNILVMPSARQERVVYGALLGTSEKQNSPNWGVLWMITAASASFLLLAQAFPWEMHCRRRSRRRHGRPASSTSPIHPTSQPSQLPTRAVIGVVSYDMICPNHCRIYRVLQKELYNSEILDTFIQRICTVFRTVIM
jgi:hypothetical protein